MYVNPLNPQDALRHHFTYLKTIFLKFLPTLCHLHPLQVENCDSNSRLAVDEDDNDKFRLERGNPCAARPAYMRFQALVSSECQAELNVTKIGKIVCGSQSVNKILQCGCSYIEVFYQQIVLHKLFY